MESAASGSGRTLSLMSRSGKIDDEVHGALLCNADGYLYALWKRCEIDHYEEIMSYEDNESCDNCLISSAFMFYFLYGDNIEHRTRHTSIIFDKTPPT